MKVLFLVLVFCSFLSPGFAIDHIFTSADGTKTFEGTIRRFSVKTQMVTVERLKDKKLLTFHIGYLSKKDQDEILEVARKMAEQLPAGAKAKSKRVPLVNVGVSSNKVGFEGFINYGSPIRNSNGTVITPNRIVQPVFSGRSINTSVTVPGK